MDRTTDGLCYALDYRPAGKRAAVLIGATRPQLRQFARAIEQAGYRVTVLSTVSDLTTRHPVLHADLLVCNRALGATTVLACYRTIEPRPKLVLLDIDRAVPQEGFAPDERNACDAEGLRLLLQRSHQHPQEQIEPALAEPEVAVPEISPPEALLDAPKNIIASSEHLAPEGGDEQSKGVQTASPLAEPEVAVPEISPPEALLDVPKNIIASSEHLAPEGGDEQSKGVQTAPPAMEDTEEFSSWTVSPNPEERTEAAEASPLSPSNELVFPLWTQFPESVAEAGVDEDSLGEVVTHRSGATDRETHLTGGEVTSNSRHLGPEPITAFFPGSEDTLIDVEGAVQSALSDDLVLPQWATLSEPATEAVVDVPIAASDDSVTDLTGKIGEPALGPIPERSSPLRKQILLLLGVGATLVVVVFLAMFVLADREQTASPLPDSNEVNAAVATDTLTMPLSAASASGGNASPPGTLTTGVTGTSPPTPRAEAQLSSYTATPVPSQQVERRVTPTQEIVSVGADLTVDILRVVQPQPVVNQVVNVQLMVRNMGTQDIDTPFWVDLYVSPRSIPGVNQSWDTISSYGSTWLIERLPAGDAVTLETLEADPSRSNLLSFPVQGEFLLYALVDSFGVGQTGAIPEMNERNNLSNPFTLFVSAPSNS